MAQLAPFSDDALAQNLRTLMGSARHAVFVAAKEGSIVGVLAALTNQLFYSTKQFVTEVWFYVTPEGRGAGVVLARAYLAWAKTLPGVSVVNLSVNLSEDADRVERLYGALGLRKTGANFVVFGG